MLNLLRAARDGAQIVFESLWVLGFKILGRLHRPTVSLWKASGGERALVVAPHPDDEVYGCGATLVVHGRAGDRVLVAFVTDGRRSRAFGLGPQEMADLRRKEAESAAGSLQIEAFDWLGLPEGDWEKDDLASRLREIVRTFEPDFIYAPSSVDFHPEHHRVAEALAAALGQALAQGAVAADVRVRVFEIQVPLTSILTNVVVEAGDAACTSAKALHEHRSQRGATLPSLRQKRYAAAYYGLGRQAEVFWEMSAATYVELHASGPSHGTNYRGLRYLSISDPLAYLVGRARRRLLRRRARCQTDRIRPGRGVA